MTNRIFPRNRDEWLEPPDEEVSHELILDYISKRYIEVEAGVYYDRESEDLVAFDEEDFEVDSSGEVHPTIRDPEPEQVFQLAIKLIEDSMDKGEDK